MQHDRGCVCQGCTSTSTTDTVLVGIVIISGVVIAISTGSKLLVAGAIAVLVGLVIRKLQIHHGKNRPSERKGLG